MENLLSGESPILEYKESLPSDSKKWLKTVVAFANGKEYTGSVIEQVEEAYKFVLRNIQLGAKIKGLYREDVYELPVGAIRELIVNAIVHRNYLENSNIQIALYDDRLEITTPGGFPKGISVGLIREGFSKIRNEALANAFFYMKLIEQWGSGIPRIIQQTKDFGLKELEIVEMESFVRFNLFRTLSKYSELYTEPNDEKFGINEKYSELHIEENKEKFGIKAEDFGLNSDDYTETEIMILKEIASHPTVTAEELAEKLKITQRAVEKQIKKLRDNQIIERVGSKKTGFYQIIKGKK